MGRSDAELAALMGEGPPPPRSDAELDALMAGPAPARSDAELDALMAGPAPVKDIGAVRRAWNSATTFDPVTQAGLDVGMDTIKSGLGAAAGAVGDAWNAAKPVTAPAYDYMTGPDRKPGDDKDIGDVIYRGITGGPTPALRQEALEAANSPEEFNKGGFQRAVEHIDRPRNAIANTAERALSGTLGEAGVLGAIGEGLTRKRVVSGSELLKATDKAGWAPMPGVAEGMKYLFGDDSEAVSGVAGGFLADVAIDPATYLTGGASAGGKAAKTVTTAARDARLFARPYMAPEAASTLGKALAKMSPEAKAAALAGESLTTTQAIREGQTGVRFMGLTIGGKRAQAAIAGGMGRVVEAVAPRQAKEFSQWANRLFGTELGLTNDAIDINRMDYFSRQEMLAKMAEVRHAAQGERKVFDDTARRLSINVTEGPKPLRGKALDKFTKERRQSITDIWEKREIDAAGPKHLGGDGRLEQAEYDILKKYQARSPEQLAEAQAAGIDVTKLVSNQDLEYVHHLMTPEAMKWINRNVEGPDLQAKVQRYLSSLKRDANPGFAKKRLSDRSVIESNQAAAEGGMKGADGTAIKLLEDDPVVIMAAREMAQIKAVGAAKMLDRIHDVFGVAAPTLGKGKSTLMPKAARELAEFRAGKLPTTWRMDDLAKVLDLADEDRVIIREGRHAGKAIPRDVYDFTTKYQIASAPAEMHKALKAFDAVQGWWAMWTLAPRPAFHFRNGVGNLWNNALAGIYSPKYYLQAAGVQTSRTNPAKLAAMKFTAADGTVRSGTEVYELGMRLGVDKSGQFRGGVQTLKQEIEPVSALQRVNPLSREHALIKGGALTGEAVEGNARWAHFLAKLEEGLSPEDAAMSVKKYLFDYQELTDFERKVLKRIMPFYAWSRNNVPLQLRQLKTNPGRFGRFQQAKQNIEANVEGGAVPDETLPVWSGGQFPIQTGRKGDTVGFRTLNNFFPAQDIGAWLAPLLGAGHEELTGDIAGKLTPVLKAPLEAATNTDFRKSAGRGERVRLHQGPPAELLGGRLDARANHLLRTIASLATLDTWNPGDVFGQPSTEANPDGAPAKLNLLKPFGAKTAEVRLKLDGTPEDRFTTTVLGLKGFTTKLTTERDNQTIPLEVERRRLMTQLNRSRDKHDALGEADVQRLLDRNQAEMDKVRDRFGAVLK